MCKSGFVLDFFLPKITFFRVSKEIFCFGTHFSLFEKNLKTPTDQSDAF